MPRGRRKKVENQLTADQIREALSAAEASLNELTAAVKEKKKEIRKLNKDLHAAEAAETAAKAEADKEKILVAVKNSGKSVEEILEFLQ